ncbi:MAG: hypothetical protein V4598_13395 [Bdellovibrionota bacterium]
MKVVFLLLSFTLISCSSSRPDETAEVPATTQPSTDNSDEGAFDKVMKNKECGLFDVFYDGCKTNKKE